MLGVHNHGVIEWWIRSEHSENRHFWDSLCIAKNILTGNRCGKVTVKAFSRCEKHSRILDIFHQFYHLVGREIESTEIDGRISYSSCFVEYCLRRLFDQLSGQIVDGNHRIRYRHLAFYMFEAPYVKERYDEIPPCFVRRYLGCDPIPQGIRGKGNLCMKFIHYLVY